MNLTESKPAAEKILIVDDEQGLRNMLTFGLQKRGYEVYTAEGGAQAIELAKAHSFQLAVCDIMMPGMDGVQVLKKLKEMSPATEVIMATGFATLETAVESMKLGAYDYITKPYSLGTLCTILEKATEHYKLKARVNRLEELDRLKNEFIHTMNHELRTPLASVLGYISLMRQGIYGSVTDVQRDAMGRAEVNSKYLLQLINSILDFTKLEANRITLSPEAFPLKDLMQDVGSVMEPLAAEKNLAISIDRPENVTVFCDRMRLQQILLNLVGNAVKFTDKGSIHVDVTWSTDDENIAIRVKDTGVGIAPESLPLLFQDFRQIDGSDTRIHRGIGLNLAISKRLAEKMEGTIIAQSKQGSGSVFVVNLPILQKESVPSPGQALAVADFSQERVILSIDDDPDILKLATDGVNGAGFRVVTAKSGAEGLALARQLRPDCIALNLRMPNMDGWQVLHAIKNDPALKNIPVYIVSMVEDQAKAFSMGVAGYLQKPFKRDELVGQLALVQRKTQQIMILEDDAAVRDVLTTALRAEGYDVIPVSTGEEALDLIKTLCPDVLFLDLVLPGMSGFDLLAALDQLPNRDKLSVFIMTGKDLTAEEEKYLERCSHLVIQKGSQPIAGLSELLKKKIPSFKEAA